MKRFVASMAVWGWMVCWMVPGLSQARLKVVTTLPDFKSLVAEIGGERVECQSLIQGTQDPHYVDAKPSHVLRLNQADLLIYNGLGLEVGWLPSLMTQSRNKALQPGGRGSLDASQAVTVLEIPTQVDRAMGDVHGGGNPHYFTSPQALGQVALAIRDRLQELDPEGRHAYQVAHQVFQDRLASKMAVWSERLAPLAGQRVVVYHASWIYLLQWARLTRAGALEPKPGIPPSAGHVTRLLQQLQGQPVRFVIQEVYHPRRLSQVFADKAGARLLVLPSMVGAEPGIETIWDKFDHIVDRLSGS